MGRITTDKKQEVGYIAIRLFKADAAGEVRNKLKEFLAQGVTRCVLDLRNNPGGYLDAMALVGNAFTQKLLGWKVRRNGSREPIVSSERLIADMQLAILVNEGTASAAEALAEALRDTTHATLVGAPTFGRGQIQTLVSLGAAASIIIPTAVIVSPSGHRFDGRTGIQPDYMEPSSMNSGNDPALRKAIDLLMLRHPILTLSTRSPKLAE